MIRLELLTPSYFRRPKSSPWKELTVQPKHAIGDTAYNKPGFQAVKS